MGDSVVRRQWSAIVLAAVGAVGTAPASTDIHDRTQSRSMVISYDGIVASEHPLASAVGARVLAEGGSAVDAAIATNAVMGLVAPMMNGIGGDLFAIVYDAKTDRMVGLNASGWAPQGLSIDVLRRHGLNSMPEFGIHSVTVPGAVAGWAMLHQRFGTRPMAELLAPAIHYAREGFPVSERTGAWWAEWADSGAHDPDAAALYLPGGRAPRTGERFRNPDLAWSLEQIAAHGPRAFYDGPVADRILKTSSARGGTLERADLADFAPEWVEPISTEYRGWTVYELPPNEQGIAALEMLNMLETLPLSSWGHDAPATVHAQIEAKKLAYADLLRYVGDPRQTRVPVQGLLDKGYARSRAALIDPAHAHCAVEAGSPPRGADTTMLTVVDRAGNMVSLIQSNYQSFGSGIAVAGAGFALQDRGALFTLEPNHPNSLAPRKRPLHTIIPAFMTHGQDKIAFGIMGGWNQAQAHAQFVANVVDFGMTIQQAIDAPRFSKHTFAGCDVQIEDRFPATTRAALTALGHVLTVQGAYSEEMGGGQAVRRDFAAGVNYGASDPRKDGAAVPEVRGASR
jgi:gamma-glutamyltranspeptidase / glutathione hydrolase